jgi:UDP-N-acetylglucosamine 2-epimerase (non-hydrolysing)
VTLHRPSNVDEASMLGRILEVLARIGQELPVLSTVHPRTDQRMRAFGLRAAVPNGVRFLNPLPYLQCLALQRHTTVVITDSGGIQEKTTFLGVPCPTLRETTERPVTITEGTHSLIGARPERFYPEVIAILAGRHKEGRIPLLWDGKAGERIADVLASWSSR